MKVRKRLGFEVRDMPCVAVGIVLNGKALGTPHSAIPRPSGDHKADVLRRLQALRATLKHDVVACAFLSRYLVFEPGLLARPNWLKS